ncbi:MAG TPA: lysoplasmalogenase [Iamia sp.]
MTGLTIALLVLAAPVALVNWVGTATDDRRLVWAAKPTTLVLLVLAALAIDAEDPTVRLWFVLGLLLSLAGDVFLMLPEETDLPLPPFLLGLGSFLLGHIAYVVGMASDLDSWAFVMIGVLVVAAAGGVVAPRIVGGVRQTSPDLVVPVLAYMAVISTMVVFAFGRGSAIGIVGALLFYASDAILAWNRFVTPSRTLQIAVMVTYHLAQLGLVLSLLG